MYCFNQVGFHFMNDYEFHILFVYFSMFLIYYKKIKINILYYLNTFQYVN
jgi:hypothetical protein